MSRIETQYVAEDLLFHPQNSSMTNTSQYLLGDQSFHLPSLALFDSSLKLDDNSNQSFPTNFQTNNLEIPKDKNMQCWNNIQQTFSPLTNNSCNTTGVIPWTPVVPQTAFINNQQIDDNHKKIVFVGNSLQENPQNFTIMYSNSDSQNFWSTSDNSNDFSNKEDTQQSQPNEMIMNPANLYSHAMLFSNKNNVLNENIKHPDSYNFPKCWLLTNFERVEEECTIARSTMYGYYIHACIERGEKPMNSAGLGKVIGSVFGRMKNRRLGARGDSRYHYLGIKIKANSAVSSVPIFLANHYAAFHTKPNKNKSGSKNDSQMEDSSESPERSECLYDFSKQRVDLKKLESLEQQPMNYFTDDLNSVSRFKIAIQVINSDKFVENDQSYKKYLSVFEQLYSIFSDYGADVIECFKDLNRQKLYLVVKHFWATDHQIIIDHSDENTNSISLLQCLKDHIVSKFVYHYDCKFYQLLIIKCFGDIVNDLSETYINKISNLFNAIQEGLHDSPLALSESSSKDKIKSLETAFKIINGYKEIHSLRKSKLQQLVTRHQNIVKLYNVCSNKHFENIIENFHNQNNFTFSKFVIDVKVYDDFWTRIVSLPILQTSREWLEFIKCQFLIVQNNSELSNISHVFIQEWCMYQNLMMEYLVDTKLIESQDTLLLNSLVLKMLIFLAENHKYIDDLTLKNRSVDESQ